MSKFDVMRSQCATKSCGTRAKYVSGCKCLLCRAANSRYSVERDRLRREEGDTRPIVSAEAARLHILSLAEKGVGYKQVAAAASVAKTIVLAIRQGTRPHIRQNTERAILAVDESVRGDKSLIPAGPTWEKLNELILNRGFTRAQIALWLGCKSPALQIRRGFITARTAMKVERLVANLEAGRLRRI